MPIRTGRKSKTSRSRFQKPEKARAAKSPNENYEIQPGDTPISDEELLKRSDRKVARVRDIMAGEHFQVQGIVLAELLGIYLCGFPAAMRAQILKNIEMRALEFGNMWKFVMHGPSGLHPQDVQPPVETRQ